MLLFASLFIVSASPCVVEGARFTSRTPWRVALDGGAPLDVRFRQQRVTVSLDRQRATLTIDAPVRLTASTQRVRLVASRAVSVRDGGLTLEPGAEVQWRTTRGDTFEGDVLLEGDGDELEDEDHEPALTTRVAGLPCQAFALNLEGDRPPPRGLTTEVDFVAVAPLTVWERPGAGARLVLRGDGAELPLVKRSTRGKWVEIEWTGDASTVRGWVERRVLTPSDPEMGYGRGVMCTGHHGEGSFGESRPPPRFRGTVTLAPGTPLRFEGRVFGEVTAPLEATATWDGGPLVEVSFAELRPDQPFQTFEVERERVTLPLDAGTR